MIKHLKLNCPTTQMKNLPYLPVLETLFIVTPSGASDFDSVDDPIGGPSSLNWSAFDQEFNDKIKLPNLIAVILCTDENHESFRSLLLTTMPGLGGRKIVHFTFEDIMVHVHSRKFCCCLPVRLGVFIMTILAMLGGGVIAVVGWIQVKNLRKEIGVKSDEGAIYVNAIMFTILAVIGFFGLVGAIAKRVRLVSLFSTMLCFHLAFSLGTGIYAIYVSFKRNSADAIRDCINDTDNSNVTEDSGGCESTIKIAKGLIVGIYVVTWLIQLYGCIISISYVKQLEEEKMVRRAEKLPAPMADGASA
ncbi:hypothetical protein C8J57DRAFT_1516662 [Mycena rebaudengoi]|nr:hypothetical protein C8J57DRAFT_1516662 [Mycena rebaudengoi]